MRSELEHWTFHVVDVTERRELAELFEVTAVPMAVAVDADGRTLARIANFIEPRPFAEALRRARGAR